MTKSAPEKKRARRSPQNGSGARDPTDASSKVDCCMKTVVTPCAKCSMYVFDVKEGLHCTTIEVQGSFKQIEVYGLKYTLSEFWSLLRYFALVYSKLHPSVLRKKIAKHVFCCYDGGIVGWLGTMEMICEKSMSAFCVQSEELFTEKVAEEKDVFQLFAEKIRDNKQLESRWAIMQETRVEYFRGKDFAALLGNHPELKEMLGSDKDLDAGDIADTLLGKNLLVRCDRVVKTVRPGKKKLSSWPAHLELHSEQVFSENDAFFAWAFMKRRALWQTVLSFLWPLVALAVCLFPIYPYQCKLVVLYSCAGVLFFIVTLLTLRAMVFGALYVILGKRIWFFPNINAEETTFSDLVQFWPKKDHEAESPKWMSRLTYAVGAVLFILLLRHHAPDESARARYQKKMSNIIDDVLEWSPKLALSGMMDKQATVVNVTEASESMESNRAGAVEENTDKTGMGFSSDGEEYEDIVGDGTDHI